MRTIKPGKPLRALVSLDRRRPSARGDRPVPARPRPPSIRRRFDTLVSCACSPIEDESVEPLLSFPQSAGSLIRVATASAGIASPPGERQRSATTHRCTTNEPRCAGSSQRTTCHPATSRRPTTAVGRRGIRQPTLPDSVWERSPPATQQRSVRRPAINSPFPRSATGRRAKGRKTTGRQGTMRVSRSGCVCPDRSAPWCARPADSRPSSPFPCPSNRRKTKKHRVPDGFVIFFTNFSTVSILRFVSMFSGGSTDRIAGVSAVPVRSG